LNIPCKKSYPISPHLKIQTKQTLPQTTEFPQKKLKVEREFTPQEAPDFTAS
jgi:hypothetical protein